LFAVTDWSQCPPSFPRIGGKGSHESYTVFEDIVIDVESRGVMRVIGALCPVPATDAGWKMNQIFSCISSFIKARPFAAPSKIAMWE
jgi:hypothetical protein